jgi:hypothetical protein
MRQRFAVHVPGKQRVLIEGTPDGNALDEVGCLTDQGAVGAFESDFDRVALDPSLVEHVL